MSFKNFLYIPVLFMLLVTACNQKEKLTPNEKKIKDNTDLVNIKEIIPEIIVDIKYANNNNFLGIPIYTSNKCYLRKSTAEKLKKAYQEFEKNGVKIKIFDGYRPASIQKKMWELIPDERFLANQENGNRHSRGSAIDITLVDLNNNEINMGSLYDSYTPASEPMYTNLDEQTLLFREILTSIMINNGFIPSERQWWHFDDADYKQYEVLDYPL